MSRILKIECNHSILGILSYHHGFVGILVPHVYRSGKIDTAIGGNGLAIGYGPGGSPQERIGIAVAHVGRDSHPGSAQYSRNDDALLVVAIKDHILLARHNPGNGIKIHGIIPCHGIRDYIGHRVQQSPGVEKEFKLYLQVPVKPVQAKGLGNR